ncbi:MAG: hypothetical protein V2J14_02290, partial [Erythrobacter sp.]|nr:hypothetical protein [Erythrobacter sp.]
MRKSIATICSLALVMPGFGGVSLAQEPSRAGGEREGYCRLPAALPDLGPEKGPKPDLSPNRFVREGKTGAAAEPELAPPTLSAPPPPPPSPPPPPPPPPPPSAGAMAEESADADSTLVVTASRVDRSRRSTARDLAR